MAVEAGLRPFTDEHGNMGNKYVRTAVFALTDGLMSNVCMVLGIAAASGFDSRIVFDAGFVGMLGGAASMACGDWVSMKLASEAEEEEIEMEKNHLQQYPEEEEEHFTELLAEQGFSARTIQAILGEIHSKPSLRQKQEMALKMHAQFELGLDPERGEEDPTHASLYAFVWFLIGGFLPLLPWCPFLSLSPLTAFAFATLLTLLTLVLIGCLISRIANTPLSHSIRRQVWNSTLCMTFAYLAGVCYHFFSNAS